jgi:cobalt/nickel transport system permease protein
VKHNFIDRYSSLDSPLHLLDPRTKLIGFAALVVGVLMTPPGHGLVLFAYFFLIAIFMGISQIPLEYLVGRMLVLIPFVLLASIAMPRAGGFSFASVGTLVTRSVLSLLLLVLLTNTTRFPELLRGLRRLGCPRILTVNLGFLYRYIFVLTDEAMRLRQARDCRRLRRAPVKSELKLLGSMLGTLLVRSFERAESMHQAMLSRGFSGEFHTPAPRTFSWMDVGFLAGLALFITLSFWR